MTMNEMTWLVGVDLRPDAEGAVAFASFLASARREDTVIPVHVLVADHLHAALQQRIVVIQTAKKPIGCGSELFQASGLLCAKQEKRRAPSPRR